MKNQVIKVLNEQHGKEVIEYFKSLGVDTLGYVGIMTECDGSEHIYYGIINNKFDNYRIQNVRIDEIIELPTIKNKKIMLAKNLKVGEYGLITRCMNAVFLNTIIKKYGIDMYFNVTKSEIVGMSDDVEVQKLENVKITYDGCEESKSTFAKKMIVSNNKDFYKAMVKTIIYKHGDWYFELPNYENQFLNLWKYAKEIEPEKELIHLTLQEIADKLGVDSGLLRIKE